jgi:hypothetical protein
LKAVVPKLKLVVVIIIIIIMPCNIAKSGNYSEHTVLIEIASYTGCPRRNVPNFGRVFLMLKYTDITQNTYTQS